MSVALEEVNGWLDDLWCLATGLLDGAGAKDTINSIENALPFYVEDQLAGLASQLLSPASDRSLPAILRRSLQDQSANHQIQRELRAEILRFFEVFLEESILNRNVPTLVAEYAAPIVEVCMDLFAGRETNNQIKELSVHPLLLCLGLKEHLPDPRSLSRLLFPPEDEHDRHGGGGKRRSVVDIYWGGFGLGRATSKTTPNVKRSLLPNAPHPPPPSNPPRLLPPTTPPPPPRLYPTAPLPLQVAAARVPSLEPFAPSVIVALCGALEEGGGRPGGGVSTPSTASNSHAVSKVPASKAPAELAAEALRGLCRGAAGVRLCREAGLEGTLQRLPDRCRQV